MVPTDVNLESVAVLGLGRSGQAAARLLRRQGVSVVALEERKGDDCHRLARELGDEGIEVMLGPDGPPSHVTLAVTSPGLAPDHPWIRELEHRAVPIVSELECGSWYVSCPMVAITGSNGKSTLVKLCGELIQRAGQSCLVGGNYGTPLCALAERSGEQDWIVVEVSSYQLERVVSFHPRIGVLLNIQPDHLDRHGSMDVYRRTKARLFDAMQAGDLALLHGAVAPAVRELSSGTPHWQTFGVGASADYRVVAGQVQCPDGTQVPLAGTRFDNPVLGLAAAAATAVASVCAVPVAALVETLREFEPLPHRMQTLPPRGGVHFVNDSKATNLASLAAAVAMTEGPIRLIAGGLLKEDDLDGVKEVLANAVSKAYVIGKAAQDLSGAWSGTIRCEICDNLETAVKHAWRDAEPGDTVLLSPGCASFDQFSGFEYRGLAFQQLVEMLNEEK